MNSLRVAIETYNPNGAKFDIFGYPQYVKLFRIVKRYYIRIKLFGYLGCLGNIGKNCQNCQKWFILGILGNMGNAIMAGT